MKITFVLKLILAKSLKVKAKASCRKCVRYGARDGVWSGKLFLFLERSVPNAGLGRRRRGVIPFFIELPPPPSKSDDAVRKLLENRRSLRRYVRRRGRRTMRPLRRPAGRSMHRSP